MNCNLNYQLSREAFSQNNLCPTNIAPHHGGFIPKSASKAERLRPHPVKGRRKSYPSNESAKMACKFGGAGIITGKHQSRVR
jgi:hypothetical protein